MVPAFTEIGQAGLMPDRSRECNKRVQEIELGKSFPSTSDGTHHHVPSDVIFPVGQKGELLIKMALIAHDSLTVKRNPGKLI